MKRLGFLFAVIVLVASATVVMAGPSRCGSGVGPGCGMGGPPALANLDLSAEQSAKIQALLQARLKELSPLQNQFFSKRTELRLLWLQMDPDQDKIRTKQQEISNLRDQIQEKAIKYRLQLRKVLNPAQQAQLMAFGLERGCDSCGKCGKMGCW